MVSLSVIVMAALGCGFIGKEAEKAVTGNSQNANSANPNKTLTDKAVDVAVGRETSGVPECDEVADFFEAYGNNPDDDIVTKAVKGTVVNKIKESFKKSIQENKSDKAELAKTCKEFKSQLDKYKNEQEANSSVE